MMTARRLVFLMSARQLATWMSALLVAFLLIIGTLFELSHVDIQYQLWKAGLYDLDRDTVLTAFYSDRHKQFIFGKSEAELSKRFGPLALPYEEGPYYLDFARDPRWKGKKIRYIRGTAWLIAFDHDKAVDLLLVKG